MVGHNREPQAGPARGWTAKPFPPLVGLLLLDGSSLSKGLHVGGTSHPQAILVGETMHLRMMTGAREERGLREQGCIPHHDSGRELAGRRRRKDRGVG